MGGTVVNTITSADWTRELRAARNAPNKISMQIQTAIANRASELAVKRGADTLTPAEDAELRAIWAADASREHQPSAEDLARFDRQTSNG